MIKAKKENMMILGLSYENLRRLKNDEPIKFNMTDLGFGNIEVLIFTAKDEATMIDMMRDSIGPETKIL